MCLRRARGHDYVKLAPPSPHRTCDQAVSGSRCLTPLNRPANCRDKASAGNSSFLISPLSETSSPSSVPLFLLSLLQGRGWWISGWSSVSLFGADGPRPLASSVVQGFDSSRKRPGIQGSTMMVSYKTSEREGDEWGRATSEVFNESAACGNGVWMTWLTCNEQWWWLLRELC